MASAPAQQDGDAAMKLARELTALQNRQAALRTTMLQRNRIESELSAAADAVFAQVKTAAAGRRTRFRVPPER